MPVAEAKAALDTSSFGLYACPRRPATLDLDRTGAIKAPYVASGAVLFTAGGAAIHHTLMHHGFFSGMGSTRTDGSVQRPMAAKARFAQIATKEGPAETTQFLALISRVWQMMFVLLPIVLVAAAYCIGRRKARANRECQVSGDASKDKDIEAISRTTAPRLHLVSVAENAPSPPCVSHRGAGAALYSSGPVDATFKRMRRQGTADNAANGDPALFHRMMTEGVAAPHVAKDIEAVYDALSSQPYEGTS